MLHYNACYVLYVIGIFLEINIYFLDIIALHSDYWKKKNVPVQFSLFCQCCVPCFLKI